MRGQGVWTDSSPENHKAVGFLSKTSPDLLEYPKATKPAFNVGQTSVRQRNAGPSYWTAINKFIQYFSEVTRLIGVLFRI